MDRIRPILESEAPPCFSWFFYGISLLAGGF
jgi:hypothetical protein